MSVVEITNVSKRYGDVQAVQDFNLTTRDGEFVVLVGPSGCGKTTTMRMIAGLESVTDGSIRIGGKDVVGMIPKERDVAMVFQNYALFPHMNVFGNLSFGLRLRKAPKETIEEEVRRAAKILNIEHLLARKPREFSGGDARQATSIPNNVTCSPPPDDSSRNRRAHREFLGNNRDSFAASALRSHAVPVRPLIPPDHRAASKTRWAQRLPTQPPQETGRPRSCRPRGVGCRRYRVPREGRSRTPSEMPRPRLSRCPPAMDSGLSA